MRKLMLTLLCCLVMSPAMAAVVGKTVAYQVGDKTFEGYFAYDDTIEGARPGVLVVHEWWGQNEYARMRADMLAELGYAAFAVDMYGEGKTTEDPAVAGVLSKEVYGNLDEAKMIFEAAIATLHDQDEVNKDKTAAIGYCFGGGMVLRMARRGVDLDGVASFHGNLEDSVTIKPGTMTTKVLVLHGNEDPMVPPSQVEAFKNEMIQAQVDYKFVGYAGATHAFTNPKATAVGKEFNLPVAYDEAADKASWVELTLFLEKILSNEE